MRKSFWKLMEAGERLSDLLPQEARHSHSMIRSVRPKPVRRGKRRYPI